MALRYAVDTNVLLPLYHLRHPLHDTIAAALRHLGRDGVELCFTPQNLGEFWNVSTRAIERNGFGLSVAETYSKVRSMEAAMTVLVEDDRVYRTWSRRLLSHEVHGVQVHDAHLAAVLEVHGVKHLLTLNGPDFKRFPNVIAIHPQEVVV